MPCHQERPPSGAVQGSAGAVAGGAMKAEGETTATALAANCGWAWRNDCGYPSAHTARCLWIHVRIASAAATRCCWRSSIRFLVSRGASCKVNDVRRIALNCTRSKTGTVIATRDRGQAPHAMKSAVLSESSTILSVDSPNVYVSEAAQRRLEALRSSVEVRLAALEAALADPSRGDALETLILDLARVACEESQAAAVQACADTRLEAEVFLGQARASAQAAVDQEFASSADVRRLLDEAQQRILVLQHENEEGVRQAREASELDLSKERAARTELERAVALLERSADEARSDLTTERAQANNLQQELDRLDAQLRTVQQEQWESTPLRERLEADLARAREATAESQRAHAETQAQLAVERNSVSELRRASEKAADQLAVLGRRESEARNSHEHITKVY